MKARVLFHIGNVILFLIGAAHTAAHLSPPPAPVNSDQQRLLELLGSVPFEMPSGEFRTYESILTAFSLYFAVFPIGTAAILWASARSSTSVQTISLVTAILLAILALVTLKFAIFPPALMMIVAAACFLAAALLERSRSA